VGGQPGFTPYADNSWKKSILSTGKKKVSGKFVLKRGGLKQRKASTREIKAGVLTAATERLDTCQDHVPRCGRGEKALCTER